MKNAVWSSVNTNAKEYIQQILILSKKLLKELFLFEVTVFVICYLLYWILVYTEM